MILCSLIKFISMSSDKKVISFSFGLQAYTYTPCLRFIHCESVTQAAVVHFNFRAGSTFPVTVCTVPHGHWVNKTENQQD